MAIEVSDAVTGIIHSADVVVSGDIVVDSVNGVHITTGTGTIAVGAKTLSVVNSLELKGTDNKAMTFPSTDAVIARTDAGQTFTGTQTFGAVVATTVNGNTITTGTGTLTLGAGSTLATSATNSITLTSAGATNVTLPTSGTLAILGANTFTAAQLIQPATDVAGMTVRGHASATANVLQIQKSDNTPFFTVKGDGHLVMEGVTTTGATGTGKMVFDTAPTLGAVTVTSLNGHTFTTGSSTFTGTAGQTYTFPTTTASIARTDAAQTFTGVQTHADSIVLPKTSGKGIKLDTVSPAFGWRDITGSVKTRTSGGTVPTFTTYRGGIYQYSFGTSAGVVETFNEFHMPHDYAPGTNMYIHAHWSTISAPTGDINWMFEIAYAKGYNQAVFEGTAGSGANVTIPVTQTSSTAFTHRIAEVQMSASGGLITSAVNVSISSGQTTLTAASSLFTAADISRTVRIAGAGVAGGVLDTTITAFTSATQVTVGNAASTTVTTQPNFSYRVIDSDILEVDGMVLVRLWRDASRAADTLDVAPFLHMTDIHYQSTGVATLQRNGPAFYT